MKHLRRRRGEGDEEGFTLIELMVVVLIIAILIAIAIPTFLGAQNRSRDRGAQSNLRNALTAAKTIATDNDGFFFSAGTTPIDATAMESVEPSLEYAATGSRGVIGVTVPADGSNIFLWTQSASGNWYGMKSTSNGTVTYCKDGGADAALDAGTCAGTAW